VFQECSHLRGHVLAILTKNMDLIQFLQTYNQRGNSKQLKDIKNLLMACKLIGWIEGEIMILLSQITKINSSCPLSKRSKISSRSHCCTRKATTASKRRT